MRSAALIAAAVAIFWVAAPISGQTPPSKTSAVDAVAATEGYLNTVPAEKRAKSDAYFEGGYWLDLWRTLYSSAILILLLHTGLSARMRDWAERLTRRKPIQTFLYWLQFLAITTVAATPLSVYNGFFREHQYNLSTQTFGAWLGDQLKGFLVAAVMGGILVVSVYGVIRRAPKTWWLWGSVVMVTFFIFGVMITPVFIAPLFNKYTPLEQPSIKGPILAMAHANGVRANKVYVMDASRQTTRISANVSGMLGTERITLNDNLLRRGTVPEIKAVMGHEIGHYVLHHVHKLILMFGLVIVVVMAFMKWGSERVIGAWGERWKIQSLQDVASLPLLVLLMTVAFYVVTPVTNTIIRVHEAEADLFGLNAAGEPEGFATVALKLGEYRKLAPGPVEEFIFFDHPSGRSRILMAMRWKESQPRVSGRR